jgi:hypothetical protein
VDENHIDSILNDMRNDPDFDYFHSSTPLTEFKKRINMRKYNGKIEVLPDDEIKNYTVTIKNYDKPKLNVIQISKIRFWKI